MNTSQVYDVIIIGAGSVGVPAAFSLAQKGVKVLVLDKNASAGQGANKAAIGGVRATHSDPAKIKVCLRSLEILKSWKDTYGQDIDWVSGGYSFLAYGEKEKETLQSLLSVQKSYGLNIDWYEKAELLEQLPGLYTEGLLGGTLSPEDGFCSNLLANHAMYQEACRLGAGFRFREEVTEFLLDKEKVYGVKTNKDTYQGKVLINAAGPQAKEVGRLLGLEHPVNPDSHEAGITEPVQEFMKPLLIDIRHFPSSANAYFYQQKTGQVIFCMTPDPPIWGFDTNETSEFLPQVSERLLAVMPRLSYLRVRRTWRGLYPMTPDGFPVVGWQKEIEGYFTAVGMCGQGFMLGPGLGEWISRMITQSELSDEDRMIAESFSPYREFSGKEALK